MGGRPEIWAHPAPSAATLSSSNPPRGRGPPLGGRGNRGGGSGAGQRPPRRRGPGGGGEGVTGREAGVHSRVDRGAGGPQRHRLALRGARTSPPLLPCSAPASSKTERPYPASVRVTEEAPSLPPPHPPPCVDLSHLLGPVTGGRTARSRQRSGVGRLSPVPAQDHVLARDLRPLYVQVTESPGTTVRFSEPVSPLSFPARQKFALSLTMAAPRVAPGGTRKLFYDDYKGSRL